ncbi:MAG TPA: hypothetical protein PK509_16165, partial [Catalimonadaceae bacterium]|nr:hypothetical protein [Catalimonadaceae bacterium]
MIQPNTFRKTTRQAFMLLMAVSQTFSLLAQSPKRKQFIETNGPVQTIKQDGNILYMGGSFTGAGYKTGRAALMSTSNDFPNASFPRINGTVNAIISDNNNGWFIGGNFSKVGTTTVANLVHILADKTVDPNFLPNPNSTVQSLTLAGGKLYVGGSFTNIGSNAYKRLAALDPASGVPTDWNPGVDNTIYSIDVNGNVVTIGGSFSKIGDKDVSYYAKIDGTTGNVLPAITFNSYIYSLRRNNGALYAGGSFTSGGFQTGKIAHFSGTNDQPTFTFPRVTGAINAIIDDGAGGWYIGGSFYQVGGINKQRLAH